jgi:hypothetical protein
MNVKLEILYKNLFKFDKNNTAKTGIIKPHIKWDAHSDINLHPANVENMVSS